MTQFIRWSILLALVPWLESLNATAAGEWTTFVSPGGYMIDYPTGWTVFEKSEKQLWIMSSRERAKGAIIVPGEASIVMGEVVGKPWNEVLYQAQSPYLISNDDIDLPESNNHQCRVLHLVKMEIPIASEHTQVFREIFCKAGERVFTIFSSHWKADGDKNRDEEITMEMIKSLKLQ